MIRLLAATLAVALFVAPAVAGEPCAPLAALEAGIAHAGLTVLGVKPLPDTAARLLYWVDREGNLNAAIVGRSGDGQPCVAVGYMTLGAYIPDVGS
jgi:hypothetical protein